MGAARVQEVLDRGQRVSGEQVGALPHWKLLEERNGEAGYKQVEEISPDRPSVVERMGFGRKAENKTSERIKKTEESVDRMKGERLGPVLHQWEGPTLSPAL